MQRLRSDQIDWLQGEALGSECPPQLLYRNGRTLDQQKAAMSADQLARQREIEAVFRRRLLRVVSDSRR